MEDSEIGWERWSGEDPGVKHAVSSRFLFSGLGGGTPNIYMAARDASRLYVQQKSPQ